MMHPRFFLALSCLFLAAPAQADDPNVLPGEMQDFYEEQWYKACGVGEPTEGSGYRGTSHDQVGLVDPLHAAEADYHSGTVEVTFHGPGTADKEYYTSGEYTVAVHADQASSCVLETVGR